MDAQADLCLWCSHMAKTGFLMTWPILPFSIIEKIHLKRNKEINMKMSSIMTKPVYARCKQPEDHWSCIAHLIAEDVLKSAVIEEKKFKNIECK